MLNLSSPVWLSVCYHLQISNIGPAQQTIDQKLTSWLFDQLYVNQIIWPHLRYQLYSSIVPPMEKVFNALIYQSMLTQNWLFLNNVKNDKFVSFLSYESFWIMILWFLCSPFSYIKYLYHNIKIKLSLTRKRRKALTYAYKISDKLPNVNFFMQTFMAILIFDETNQ